MQLDNGKLLLSKGGGLSLEGGVCTNAADCEVRNSSCIFSWKAGILQTTGGFCAVDKLPDTMQSATQLTTATLAVAMKHMGLVQDFSARQARECHAVGVHSVPFSAIGHIVHESVREFRSL
jgi:hypothetical protein